MNGARGAKGSINDRLISMLYRKRYKEYMKKLESYNKTDRTKKKEYFTYLKDNVDIDEPMDNLDIEDKKELEDIFKDLKVEDIYEIVGSEVIEPKSQSIDLKAMDEFYNNTYMNKALAQLANESYYEIINQKTQVGALPVDEVLDVDTEIRKADDEITIIDELNTFVDDSVELLSEIKSEINSLKKDVSEAHTKEEIDALEERYIKLREKVTLLKEQYETVALKYNFEDFAILDNIKMMDAIDDYKSVAQLEELELLSDACRIEIEAIDGVLVEEKRRVGLEDEIIKKEDEIVTRDNDFEKSKVDTIYYTKFEKDIAREVEIQKQAIAEFWIGLSKVDTSIVTTHDYIYHTNQMFASFLRIAGGLLTLPFSNIGSMALGTHLINRGVRQLRRSMVPDVIERNEEVINYTSIEDDIKRTSESVENTNKFLNDTIKEVDEFQKVFKEKFSDYAEYIPDYYKIASQIENLSIQLRKKREEIKEMEKTLDKQYEDNKQKVLRAR